MKNYKLLSVKRLNIALIIGLILTIITSQFVMFASDCNEIRENSFRLHILANSNSQIDQQLKLMVRDEILKSSDDIFDTATNKEDAKINATKNIDKIQKIARDTLKKNGCFDEVSVKVCNMFFETRVYETFTLPAGYYDALRVEIGSAVGNNWWCVLYPSLCIPAATSVKDEQLQDFSDEQIDIIENSEKYEIKFMSIELFEKFKKLFRK